VSGRFVARAFGKLPSSARASQLGQYDKSYDGRSAVQGSRDSQTTVVVDYGVGNLASIVNMLRRLGAPALVSSDPTTIAAASRLILPGVGAFDHAMKKLREGSLLSALERRVRHDRVPLLGLCLGAQLLTHASEEGCERGLGWIDATTVRFDQTRAEGKLRVPHMGWSDVKATRAHALLATEEADPRFYFAHSYHLSCNDPALTIGTATYGYAFPAAIAQGNVLGVQFHPEKSHVFGMRLLQNFCEWTSPYPASALT
jgi:imidazole glycerol-phosphate synthase subunit HisH